MATPDFERCTAVATELLYKQNIKNRILDIQHLNYGDKKIIFDTIQNYAFLTRCPLSDFYCEERPMLKDGCLIIYDNMYFVLYNAEITYWEHLNWTLAHEIGHIYMEHKEDGPTEEIEAHFFAAQLFMPEYSILMMSREHGKISIDDLVEVFGVSPEAASKRLETMRKKRAFRASSIDKTIWAIQKERVDMYYECDKDSYTYRNLLNYMLEREEEYILELERDMEAFMALG